MENKALSKATGFIDYFTKDYRRAIVVGVVLVVIIVLIIIFRARIKSLWQRITNKIANNDMENQWNKETGEVATLSIAQLQVMANKLYNAFNYTWGTDEDAIYAVFNQVKNTADVYALISAYGTRDGLDLPGEIRDELNNREINKVNTILTNKGIAYNF